MAGFVPYSNVTATKSVLSVLGRISDDPANVIYLKNYQAENKHCNEGLTKLNGSSGKTLITTHASNSTRFNFSGTGKVEFVENGTTTLREDYRAHMFVKDGELYTPQFEAQLTGPTFQALSTVPGLLSFSKYVPGMTVTVDLTKVPVVSPDLADFDALVEGLCREAILKVVEKNLKALAKAQEDTGAPATVGATTPATPSIPVQQVEVEVPYCEYTCDYVPTDADIQGYKGTLSDAKRELRATRYANRARELAVEEFGVPVHWIPGKQYKAKGGAQQAYTIQTYYNGVPVTVTKKVGNQKIKVDA